MDHIDEAYYLGGDFDGDNDCRFYYMAWRDQTTGRWYAGLNSFGLSIVPFSKVRCAPLGSYSTLRDALSACEAHASNRPRRFRMEYALAT